MLVALLTFVGFSTILQVSSRRYDIEEESLKLFGENVKTVVARFRKTPEYNKMIAEEMALLVAQEEMAFQFYHQYYLAQLNSRIMQDLGLDKTTTEGVALVSGQPGPVGRMRNHYNIYPYHSRKRDERNSDTRRNYNDAIPSLDAFYSDVVGTTKERNHYRNLGFEYAGQVIHHTRKVLEESGDNVAPPSDRLSTMSPDETERPTQSTTEHVSVHHVDEGSTSHGIFTDPPVAVKRKSYKNV